MAVHESNGHVSPSSNGKIESFSETDVDFEQVVRQAEFFWNVVRNATNVDQWHESVSNQLNESKDPEQLKKLGISSLQWFVEINWTGREEAKNLSSLWPHWDENVKSIAEEITADGDDLNPVIRSLPLFFVARSVLFNKNAPKSDSILRWKFRLLWVHQQLLSEKSEQIHQDAIDMIENLTTTEKNSVEFWLEYSTFFSAYYDITRMKEGIDKALAISGLDVQETGILGKRTKFQQNDLPQLTLDISKTKDNNRDVAAAMKPEVLADLPVDLKLDDEVRLDKIKFTENRDQTQLTKIEAAIVLCRHFYVKRSQPKDALAKEELMPHLDAVLTNKVTTWALKTSALLERSILERQDRRSVERSLMQIQTLVDSWPWKSLEVSKHRSDMIYVCKPKPFWSIEFELVQILKSMGSTKTALDLAIKLKLWEEMVNCYTLLDLKHKAVEVVREQIAKEGESPLLLCILGDATDDPDHYRKAIEMSNGRSARALRSLGNYFYYRKQYPEAVDFLGKSLKQSSFQPQVLLRHAYAAMQIENWEAAAQSYRNYCVYESDNFEAWNNLANAYIKLGQKPRAWKVLQEAVKCDYDNWKVWDNILVVSTDCAHFEEVIRAYHRILELKNGKHVDRQVLEILVRAINENLPDNYDVPSGKYRKPALELFGRLSAENGQDSSVWELYSKLVAGNDDPKKEEDLFKAAMLMQKATASFVQGDKEWHRTKEGMLRALDLSKNYADACLKSAEITTNKTQSVQQMASAKMTIRSVIAKVKQTQTENEEVKNCLAEVEHILETLVSKIESLKS